MQWLEWAQGRAPAGSSQCQHMEVDCSWEPLVQWLAML